MSQISVGKKWSDLKRNMLFVEILEDGQVEFFIRGVHLREGPDEIIEKQPINFLRYVAEALQENYEAYMEFRIQKHR